jgi:predicted MFS family arabinose efflux permease
MAAQRLCDAMLPQLAREFRVSLAEAAQVVSVFAIVYGLCQLVYGPLGDRLGKFRIVTAATLFCSVGSLLAVGAQGLGALVGARVLVALGAAAIIPLSLAWIGDAVDYAQRQATLARVGLGTTLGITGGQLLGGLFTDTLGWRWAFGFMALLFGAVGLLLAQDARRQRRAAGVRAAEPLEGRTGFMQQAWQIVSGPWSRVVLLVALIEGASGFGVLAIWASHLHHELGLSLALAGTVVALFGLGGMAYMALARWLIPRLGEHGLARSGVLLLGLASLVIAFTPLWWLAVPASPLAGFGFFMFHNTMQTHATQMAPAARGTAVALFAASLFMGQSLGVLAAAALATWLGTTAVIALGSAVLVSIGWYFAARVRRRNRQQLQKQ